MSQTQVFLGLGSNVEAYIGEVGGRDGIKLENQLLVTENGCEVLSRCPFEESFLRD